MRSLAQTHRRDLIRTGVWIAGFVSFAIGHLSAQLGDSSFERIDHPAIEYTSRAARDPVAILNGQIQSGDVRLSFDSSHGYLRSLLGALRIPTESQVVVFSKTSTQLNLVSPRNPRAVYFNDSVSVGWTRGTFVLEIAAQDPELGTMFYELDQQDTDKPVLRRTRACLRCHHSLYTEGVPGRLIRSTPTADDGTALASTKNLATSHRTPYDQRWGGWFVTGKTSALSHMGNVFANRSSNPSRSADPEMLTTQFNTNDYLSPYSDVVALMVLDHQARLTNMLTRLGWETRAAEYERLHGPEPSGRAAFSFDAAVREVVDYLLYVDEAPLPGLVQGTSGFAEWFARQGPFDRQGRSLRQLDLQRRLARYPCSYMIYSAVFDELPDAARNAIYRRMWAVLTNNERGAQYEKLSESDRLAVLQILRETKQGLPDYFR